MACWWWNNSSSVLWHCWLGGWKGIRPVKELRVAGVVICLGWGADLHTAQLMPLPLTVSCFSKIEIGYGTTSPTVIPDKVQRAVKWMCVCVHVYMQPCGVRACMHDGDGDGENIITWLHGPSVTVEIFCQCWCHFHSWIFVSRSHGTSSALLWVCKECSWHANCRCFRVHYPLPLPYMGKPDPSLLQRTIRQLQQDIDILRQQVIFMWKFRQLDKISLINYSNSTKIKHTVITVQKLVLYGRTSRLLIMNQTKLEDSYGRQWFRKTHNMNWDKGSN